MTSKSFETTFGSAIQGMFVTWSHTPDSAPLVPLSRNGNCVNSPANSNCNLKMTIQLNLYTLPLSTGSIAYNNGKLQALDIEAAIANPAYLAFYLTILNPAGQG